MPLLCVSEVNMKHFLLSSALTIAIVTCAGSPLFGEVLQDIDIQRDMRYATHDGVALLGDYYVPKGPGKFPVVVAMHGGAWQLGDRTAFPSLGPYLAQRGI